MSLEPSGKLYQYNLLFIGQESAGLHILTTPCYISLVQQKPGLHLENYGDFYSEIECNGLANRIYRALEEYGLEEDAEIVSADSLDKMSLNPTKDYIITMQDRGVRLYSPQVHQEEEESSITEGAYFIASMCFLEHLFSSRKEGSLQTLYRQLPEKLAAAIDKGVQKGLQPVKEYSETLQGLSRKLKELNERLQGRKDEKKRKSNLN